MSTEIKKELVDNIEKLNKKKTELETTKTILDKQLLELDKEIKEKGYDPEKLPEVISTMEKEITEFEKTAEPIVNDILSKLQTVENEEHTSSDDFSLEK